MAADYSVFGTPALVPDDVADRSSVTVAYAASPYSTVAEAPSPDRFDPDEDPTGVKTKRFLDSHGMPGTTQSILSAKLANGRRVSREWLEERPEGQRLLSIMADNRAGHKRGFLDAVSDVGVNDLPYMSLVGQQAGSISAAVRVSDTFRKMQNGEALTDEEALSATLYMTEAKWKEDGTWGSTVGEIIRAAPGFMLEFLGTGGLFSSVRSGVRGLAQESIHVGMARTAKVAARELVEAGAKSTVKDAGEITALAASKGAGKRIVDDVTRALTNPKNGLLKNNPLYRGMSDEALERMARNRAVYELGEYKARSSGGKVANSLASTYQWAKRHFSQGLMDFGSWGTEEATAVFTNQSKAGRALADAVGAFFVEAPVKGALMYAPNAFVAKPLVGASFGEDGRTVSQAQLGLEASAYLTGNRELMERAEVVAMGMNLLEYVSENAGRGFSSLLRSAGLGLERLGVRGLVAPAQRAINETGDLIPLADSATTVGGKMREMIGKALGSRQEFMNRVANDEFAVASKALGVSGREEELALRTALMTRSVSDLPERIAAKAGDDFGKFMTNAMKSAYDDATTELAYKSYARFAVANYMARHNIGPESVMNLWEKMGYDGILGEMFEERYSDVAKGLMGLDDRKTHDFLSNVKEAVKGLYPGFDQLTAEAVGFAMPLVTRAATMRTVSWLGGGGKVAEMRERLDAMDDAFRVPLVEEMTPGQYFASYDAVSRDLQSRIAATRTEIEQERSAGNEEAAAGLENQLKTMETEAARRRTRHEKMTGMVSAAVETENRRLEQVKGSPLTTEELARTNASLLLNIPQLTEAQYRSADAEYNRITLPTLEQVDQSVVAQRAMESFAGELAEQLYTMENPPGDPSRKWLRSAAQKIVGFAGAVVTGDMSLATANPAKFVARDMGVSKAVCDNLREGFEAEWKRQKNAVQTTDPFAPIDGITAATREKFAPTAARIMRSSLIASQIRSFSQSDMRDQALGQVAREQGYQVDTEGQRLVKFTDGSFDESTAVSFEKFYESNREAVDSMRDQIAVATADLVTNRLTAPSDREALMNVLRLPADSEIARPAVYELAMRMSGLSGVVREKQLGDKPVEEELKASALGRVSHDVASYVAARRRAGQPVDGMAYASLADSLGLSYDGTDDGLAKRNAKIDMICDLLDFGRDPSVVFLSKEIAYDKADTRFQRAHSVMVKGRLNTDGTVTVRTGYDENGNLVSDTKSLDDWRKDGYVRADARTVITQKQLLSTTDMYLMLRQLGELGNYKSATSGAKNGDLHPMLREYTEEEVSGFLAAHPEFAGKSADNIHEAIAEDTLRREIAVAQNAEEVGDRIDVVNVPKGQTKESVEATWRRLYDSDTGYMRIGERLLERRGVRVGDAVSGLSGQEAGSAYRRKYEFLLQAGGGTVASADYFVPIDVAHGEDFITGLLAAHLGRAYATHARLLSESLGSTMSDFARGVDAVIEQELRARDIPDSVRASLRLLQAKVTNVDRTVVGEDGNTRVVRGVGLTQQSFIELAQTFALFQDVRRGQAGLMTSPDAQALATVAKRVRMLPSWPGFLNVVDLTLGGNGFLSEYLRGGKPVEGSELRGVRRLMQIVGGTGDAFAKAVRESLPGGMDYKAFLEKCVETATSMSKNPIASVKVKPVSEKDRTELEEIATRPDSPAKHCDFFGKLAQAVGLEGQALTEFLTEAIRTAGTEPANRVVESGRLAYDIRRKEQKVVTATVKLLQAEKELRDLNAKIAGLGREIRVLNEQGKSVETTAAELNRLRDEAGEKNAAVRALQQQKAEALAVVQATREGSDPEKARRSAAKGGSARVDLKMLTPRQNTVVQRPAAPRFADTEDEGEFSVGALPTDYDRDLNDLFARQTSDRILSENHVVSREDARLNANTVVRASVAVNGNCDESQFLKTFDTLFPTASTEDRLYCLQMFRQADAARDRDGLTWDELAQNGATWQITEDGKDEADVSDESFNRTAVNEYNNEALASFLANAELASPETGRNFQAFATNIRENIRDIVSHFDVDGLDTAAREAFDFLNRLMNPRADKVGKTFNERKARYDRFVSETLNDTEKVRDVITTLLTGGGNGKPLSRKGAFLLSYLSSLPVNVRLNFTDLISSSAVSSPVEVVRIFAGGKSEWSAKSAVHPDYSVAMQVVYGVASPFVGMTPVRLKETAAAIRKCVTGKESGWVAPGGSVNPCKVIETNGRIIADALAQFFGRESAVYSALTSPLAARRRQQVYQADENGGKGLMAHLASSMSVSKYGGIGLLNSLASVLEATAASGKTATRELLRSNMVTMFTTGDLSLGSVTMAPNTSKSTDDWNTLMATFGDAQPKTIMNARVDQRRDGNQASPSIAIASRGVVPIVSRFMDAGFAEMCAKYFPNATEDEIAECRQDMTWPDRYRTPIVAKNISKSYDAVEVLRACANSFGSDRGPVWVPVYAGDHSSAVMIQVPAKIAADAREKAGALEPEAGEGSLQFTVRRFEPFAREVCEKIGLDLLGDDTKRSALSSLEAVGTSTIGVKGEDTDGNPQYGENRIHIVYNYALRDAGGKDNEFLFGTTMIVGYGAEQQRLRAAVKDTGTLKLHAISTSGAELAFIKSLAISPVAARGEFAEGSAPGQLFQYLSSRLGKDAPHSTHVLTDKDSYKIGVAGSKQISVLGLPGREAAKGIKVMDWLFKELEQRTRDGSFSLSAEDLDAVYPDGVVVDFAARGEKRTMKLSELLPGVDIRTVDGFNGPVLDISFREDGMTLYSVANVAHDSRTEVKRTPRNHEIDAMAMAAYQERTGVANSATARTVFETVANWGLLASAYASNEDVIRHLAEDAQSVEEMHRYGEEYTGQNSREELAKTVWSVLRKANNIPMNCIEAPLVSAAAEISGDGRSVFYYGKSRMYAAMMKGSQVFTRDEQAFYGTQRRLALCNANCNDASFRYGWFLDESRFYSEFGVAGDEAVLKKLEELFTQLRDGRVSDRSEVRGRLASCFVDHHGVRVSEKTVKSRAYFDVVSFEDLFIQDHGNGGRKFDRSAVQIGGDRVFNDATGKSHIFLGGTSFGLPRTPSYNGSMWLQVVRAGLPVTERKLESEDGSVTYLPGRDAMVSPDPFTNRILGCDHDGDKTKMYMFSSQRGEVAFAEPPAPGESFDADDFAANGESRREHFEALRNAGWFDVKYRDPDGRVVTATDGVYREGQWYEINETAKKQVSNTFVRALFDMARDLECKPAADERQQFADGPMSRETKANPLDSDTLIERLLDEVGAKKVINKGDTLGKPLVAALVSKMATDAANARAMIVSLAAKLHVAWTSGYFKGTLFRGMDDASWVKFMYLVDGISNATFDDIKNQKCSRLGWTSTMMDSLITAVLMNNGSARPPTTSSEMYEVLRAFAKDINRDNGRFAFMKRVSDETDDAMRIWTSRIFGANPDYGPGRGNLLKFFSLREKGKKVKRVAPRSPDAATVGEALAYALEKIGGSMSMLAKGGFSSPANSTRLGYLTYLAVKASGVNISGKGGADVAKEIGKVRLDLTDADTMRRLESLVREFKDFETLRDTLSQAGAFSNSVNYLNADAGNENSATDADRLGGTFIEVVGEDVATDRTDPYTRMNAVTRATYDIGFRLITTAVEAKRALAESDELMRGVEAVGSGAARETVAGLRALGGKYEGKVSPFDRNALQANAQMVPYIIAALRSFRDGKGPFADPKTAFDTLMKAGELVDHGKSKVLSLRYGVESAFDLMYRLAVSSAESVDNNVFSYFTMSVDSRYERGDYLGSGKGLRRIRPAFKGGTVETQAVSQALVRDVIEGRSFAKERSLRFGRKAAAAKSFSLTTENLDAMLSEAGASADSLLRDEIATVKKMLPAFDGEITPAMMFSKLLPAYTVVTERTLGAPDPRSGSLLGILGNYSDLSKGQVELTQRNPDLLRAMVAYNFAPVRGQVVKTTSAGEKVTEDDRTNPDYRHTVDIFTDGLPFRSALDAFSEDRKYDDPNDPGKVLGGKAGDPASFTDRMFAGEKDPAVETVANAMRAALGSWANVEYKGGSAFVIFGDLKGDAAVVNGRPVRAVITVNVGDLLNSEEDVEALANSRAYAASLTAAVDLGINADEFLHLLPLETRKALVRRFGVGGFSSNKVTWNVTGGTIATALNITKGDDTVFHEYFHSIMRMFESLNVLTDEDYVALEKQFGRAPEGRGWRFDEERAAEAFRKWVRSNEAAGATDPSGVFAKIRRFLTELWEALKSGFSYGVEAPADETLFRMVIGGVAEGSRERKALGEVAAAVNVSQTARTLRELAEESVSDLMAAGAATQDTGAKESFVDLHGEGYDALCTRINRICERGRLNKVLLADAVRAAVDAGRPIAEALGIEVQEPAPDTAFAEPPFQPAEPGTEEAGIEETEAAVKLATVPLVETSPFWSAGYNISREIENGLKADGSWRGDLESAVKMQNDYNRRNRGVDLADKAIVVRALRQVISVVNPKLKVSRKELEGSLAFEAALVMSARLKQAFVNPAPQGAKAEAYLHGDETERTRRQKQRASSYDIAGWILASRAVSPGDSAEQALARLNALDATGGAARTVLARCKTAMERIAKECGDPTLTTNWVAGGSTEVLNELMPSLEAGLRKVSVDAEGFEKDYELGEGPEATDNPFAKDNYDLYSQCIADPVVQKALKVTLGTLHRVAAMDKFYRETGIVPGTAEDIEACRTFARRGIPGAVSAAEWSASQAIGPSNLADNESLADYQNQSGFIGANVDSWLMSQVRENFGGTALRDRVMAEASEYGALKSEIMHLENMQSFMLGDNVEAGGRLLKVLEHDEHFRMEDGVVRYSDEATGKDIAFDNLHRKTVNVSFTIDELRTVDLFKKMLSAYANNQKVMLTGVNRLTFNDRMSTDPAAYEWKELERRWKNAKPGSQFTRMEVACVRIMRQLDIGGVTGDAKSTLDVYNRFVNEACAAMDSAQRVRARLDVSERASFDFNSEVLNTLRARGVIAAQRGPGGAFRQGTLVLSCDAVDRMFRDSSAYRKLLDAGRKPEWISRDTLVREALIVNRRANEFVKRHAWITEGDAKYLNTYGTPVMFFGGSGVFMHDAIRVSRDRKLARTASVPRYVNSYRAACQQANALQPLTTADMNLVDVISDVFRTGEQGLKLVEAINRGDYAPGTEKANRTGLALVANATHADVAEAIYQRLLDVAWQEQVSDGKLKAGVRSIEEMIEAYEEEKGQAANFATGGMGINDVTMFERYGVLPANFQLGHKIHQAIDQITNAMMMRNTLVNMLMTPASSDGAPAYLVRPDDVARDERGQTVPDSFWEPVARWWSDYFGVAYDESKDGVANAQSVYDAVMKMKDQKGGKLTCRLPGNGDHRYTALGEAENDLVSMRGWYAIDDENLGDESSYLNAVAGGEAMGYLRQVVQCGRVLGPGAQACRQTLQRALSWSKSLSVSFSFFFPLATRFESPIGAVGAMATMLGNSKTGPGLLRKHADLMNAVQKLMPGGGWITKDFLGYSDIVRMMDTNDPFLAELKSWAAALGITISDRLVNPMEPTKSLVLEDLKRMRRMIRDSGNEKMAAAFANVTEKLLTRQGEKAFAYALNATKLAVVAQMYSKLRYEAAKRGKAFDPVRDLRKYAGYINAEVGGIDPFSYAWATPRMRNLMNVMMFSWQWTRGAWEAGGGNVLEDLLFGGHTMTRQERGYMLGRWARMWGEIMVGVPAMMQIVCKALGLALGWDDDDDKWLTTQNEGKIGISAFDLTPLLRGIERFDSTVLGGRVRDLKVNHGELFGWIPMYTGTDRNNQKTQRRRYYMHFGKQGWEFFRWFTDPGQQFFSKLSMPVQRSLEGLLGYNPSYPGHELPWNDMGAMERWLNPTTDGATFNLLKAFIPFSVNGLTEFGDAGLLPVFGPVSMGASETAIQDRLVKAIDAWAHNDRRGYKWGGRRKEGKTKNIGLVADVLMDARRNGLDPDEQYSKAVGQVMVKEYSRLFSALPTEPDGDFDAKAIARIARTLNKLGATKKNALASVKKKLKAQGRDWDTVLTPAERRMYERIVGGALKRPFDGPTREDY